MAVEWALARVGIKSDRRQLRHLQAPFQVRGAVRREHGRLRVQHWPPHYGASRDGPSDVSLARFEQTRSATVLAEWTNLGPGKDAAWQGLRRHWSDHDGRVDPSAVAMAASILEPHIL